METMEEGGGEGMYVYMYVCKWVGYLHDGRAQHLAQGGVDEHLHTYIHTYIAYSHHIQGGVVP
jgi:hypothetical protein